MRALRARWAFLRMAGAAIAGLALAALALPSAAVSLTQTPLFLASKADPNLMMALSVEWPTAETAAYSDNAGTDPSGQCPGLVSDTLAGNVGGSSPAAAVGVCYYETQTYVGYFDPAKCYSYDPVNHVFNPVGSANASTHECSGAWAGNFLNWASMTTLDEFRWAMTGGARDVDTAATASSASQTVLKRTYKAFGPSGYTFRVKRLTAGATTVGSSTVPGVRTSTVTPLAGDITLYIGSNGLNLYFWTPPGNLPPANAVACGNENATCTLPAGSYSVWFGAQSGWTSRSGVSGSVSCSNTVFGDPNPGVYKGCYYSATPTGSGFALDTSVAPYAASGLEYIGAVQVRVAVCVPAQGLESNCLNYQNGSLNNYKPTGLMQTYATSMRFAVASYLYDSNAAHNGGVLRSNMKYVGPVTKDPVNGTTSNPNAEWDANGVFVPNPSPADATASGLSCSGPPGCSGVINFINGFGYSAQSYMSYDVMSELYYEALRYFVAPQNGPTQSYVTAPWNSGGVTASERDGFPVITSWTDPIQYACQGNAILTVGDANTWCDFNLPGSSLSNPGSCGNHNSYSLANQAGASENWADVTSFANSVGAFEGLGSLGTSFGGGPPDSYYVSGLAWWAHTHDIRADVAGQANTQGVQSVSSFFIDVREPGSWGTYGSPKNQLWLGAKYGGFTIHNPQSPETSPLSVSDWSSNGTTPTTYFYGNQPLPMIGSINNLFSAIKANVGSQASLAGNSTVLLTGGKIFQSEADPGDWSGRLKAFDVSASGTVSSTYIDAGALLAAPVAANRVVFTVNNSTGAAIPFEWASLPASAQAALNTASAGVTDTRGQLRLNWLRGDSSNEGTSSTSFRVRAQTKLGDIVDSTPMYVGPVKPDGSARSAMVYVGANDGMLHAFSAGAAGDTTTTPGTTLMQEKFAFIPGVLIPNLSALSSIGYSHQFYVDGSPQVVEAAIGGTPHTVLASGLRAGGQAVFALDVTSPDTLAASETAAAQSLLWQFSSSQDADLGYTFSDPQIVRTAALDGNGNPRWAVIVGNGYKPAQTAGATNLQAALFILFLDHPSGGNTWVAGSDYVKLLTSVGSVTAAAPNGLSTPAVVANGAGGAATFVYAGDLYGNLWKFDISSSNVSNWKSALDSSTPATTPLYVAQTAAGVLQPITTAPEVVAFPLGGYVVIFGTGIALSTGDLGSTALQTLYGIRDDLSNTAVPGRASSSTALVQQQILNSSLSVSNANGSTSWYRQVSTNPVNYASAKGWYLDLLNSPGSSPTGERVVYNPLVYQGKVEFTTITPSSSNCGGGGVTWNLALNPYTGAGPAIPVYDVNQNGIFDSTDIINVGTGSLPQNIFPAGIESGAGIAPPPLLLTVQGGCGTNRCHESVQTSTSGTLSTRLENDGAAYQRDSWREVPNP